jgi:hypothetical protein
MNVNTIGKLYHGGEAVFEKKSNGRTNYEEIYSFSWNDLLGLGIKNGLNKYEASFHSLSY